MSIATEIQRLQSAKANIKSAIENKGVTVGDGTIDTYAEKIDEISSGDYDQGYEDGKNSVVDFMKYAKQIQFRPAAIIKEEVIFDLDNGTTLAMFFNSTLDDDDNIAVKNITVNCPNKIDAMNSVFFCNRNYNDNVLEKVTLNVDTSACTTIRLAFRGCRALKTIDGTPLDLTKCTASNSTENAFQYCYALKDVAFVKETIQVSTSFVNSSLLSDKSIESIISGLADLTDGTAQTLTLHADVKAKLSDTQKTQISNKNWYLA